jgi:hypothetical protein
MSSASPSPESASNRVARIYALVDPRTGDVRYIGMTVRSLKARLRDHLRDLRRDDHRTRWIRSLCVAGIRPEIIELEIVSVEDRCPAEQRWISSYRSRGARLVNATRGGAGTLGYRRTEEDKRRIGDRSRLLFQDPARRAAVSKVHRGKSLSDAHRAAIGLAASRRWAAYRENGESLSEESRERIRIAARARAPRRWSDASKAKLAATKKRSDVPDELILRLRDEEGRGWASIARQVGMSDVGVHQRYDRIKAGGVCV